MIGSRKQDPTAVRTYTINWSRWRFPAGCRILTATWSVTPDDGTIKILGSSVQNGFLANVRVGYPRDGQSYVLECHMVSTDPRDPPDQDSRRIQIYGAFPPR